MSNEHVHPIMAEVLNTFAPTAMADRFKAATKIADKGNHAMDQLYRSMTILKIYYDHAGLTRNGFDPIELSKNMGALQEFIVTVSVFADQLDEDNRIRLAWERCVAKTVDVYDPNAEVAP